MTYLDWKASVLLVIATCTVGCQLTSKPPGKSFSPTRLMQQTGKSVRDALRIEPRVVKAKDATSLDFDPVPIKPSLHLRAASLMVQAGKLEEAHSHYQKALSIEPHNRAALIGIARLYHRSGAIDKAINAYRQAAQVVGDDPVVLNDLALCLARSERYDEAIANLRSVVALKPDSLMYRNNLAAVLIQARRADEAVGVLSESHGLAVAHYNVGYMLNKRGEPAAACAHFVRALKANPSFAPAQTMLDRALPHVGQHQERRVAKRPGPEASARLPANAAPVDDATVELTDPVDLPEPTAEVDFDAIGIDLPDPDTLVQPVQYSEPIEDGEAENHVDLTELPPIRLPATTMPRPKQMGLGGFVAPAPIRH